MPVQTCEEPAAPRVRTVEQALEQLSFYLHVALDLEHDAEVTPYRCPKSLHGATTERNAAILMVTRRLETLDLRRPEHRAHAVLLIGAIDGLDISIANRGKTP